jgi:hypothetical protein
VVEEVVLRVYRPTFREVSRRLEDVDECIRNQRERENERTRFSQCDPFAGS